MTNKQKKHIHKIVIEPDGTRRMNDKGYWMCECGATIFPNCSWFEAEKQDILTFHPRSPQSKQSLDWG